MARDAETLKDTNWETKLHISRSEEISIRYERERTNGTHQNHTYISIAPSD